ncbi:uncharacterized protein BT62DRAFT_1006115 [Guyanagaster necrorhizus]|uniref:Uncharacterized protein n=1 Tax=Guyanagaster necrorhizus TaxID=856835 RepID=A0A9P7VR63_9AGAR|nr:uncharacterized protein BT62DRAFT_1006115 [Guyanagaster necrorhizus MCA 3950]KAG7445933.1 hypothetical protein BT62DRAFT_1006115 [Guyanagaster necrorhizus MCA 3950]
MTRYISTLPHVSISTERILPADPCCYPAPLCHSSRISIPGLAVYPNLPYCGRKHLESASAVLAPNGIECCSTLIFLRCSSLRPTMERFARSLNEERFGRCVAHPLRTLIVSRRKFHDFEAGTTPPCCRKDHALRPIESSLGFSSWTNASIVQVCGPRLLRISLHVQPG